MKIANERILAAKDAVASVMVDDNTCRAAREEGRRIGALMEMNVSDGAAVARARTCAYVARHLAEQGQILEACFRLGEAEGYARCIQL